MQLNEVVSSNIDKVGLKEEGLVVEFKSGARYLYKGVTKELYEKLLKAESIGRFVNTEIKGKFEFERI